MAQSSIEWTQMTWNPTTGCDKVSAGCKFCYAEVMTRRLKGMGQEKYNEGFKFKIHPQSLQIPYSWRTPKIVFVNSMSDLFHVDTPLEFIKQVFQVMNDKHIFQILTKRAERLFEVHKELNWTPNIWMGVSVENEKTLNRIEYLTQTKAQTKFLSLEPLIGPLPNLDLNMINWVIVGGESGRKPRPMKLEWILSIQDKCENANVPFFFKQWGGQNKKKGGRLLNGRTYDGMPETKAVS
jgi:protein gp37